MLKAKVAKALNEQINAEMYSSYLYLGMEAYFQSISLSGFASWMRGQVQEELFHAMKMYDFLGERRVANQAGAATPCDDLGHGAAHVDVDPVKLHLFGDLFSHLLIVFRRVAPYLRDDFDVLFL